MKLKSILAVIPISVFLLLFSSKNIVAQDFATDSSFYEKGMLNAMAIYHQSFGDQSALYNGSKYGGYFFRFTEGHQFFNSPEPGVGSVIYDGIKYDSVLMSYDEVTDVLVITTQADRIQLLTEKVEYFNLFNSYFIRLVHDRLTNSLVSDGFYDLLYKGKTWLLKKQVKRVREVIASTEVQHFIDVKDHYYLKKNDLIYPITNKKILFQLFGDRKKEVQQFIKANGLNFRRDRQNMLIKVTAYYDSLIK